jgi:hypothetical protein
MSMGMLKTLLVKTVAPTGYAHITDELAATVVREARQSLLADGNPKPTQQELNIRADSLYIEGAWQFGHNVLQRKDMHKAILREVNKGFRPTPPDHQKVLAECRERAEKYGSWLRQHPTPTMIIHRQWRDALLFWTASMCTLNADSAEWKEDFGKLITVKDDYPLGPGSLLPRGREAIKNWKRLSKKYLGIDIP